jgi:cAMP-binding proteins - catabolite gene activator and regulatory subunit of cAMP-dependent protein kinases
MTRKHTLSKKKKQIVAAILAKKIGYLKITDIVPAGIVEHLQTHSFNPHKIIGTKNRLFLVKEGTVEIWHTHHDLLVKTLEAGILFGNMSLLGQVMLGTKAISGTNGSVISEITSDTVMEWMRTNPLVSELIGARLAEIEIKHYRAALQSAHSRIAALLLDLAGESSLIEGLAHKDLALKIGLYRETVTNTLGSMKADRLIKVGRERITILDKRALQELGEL